MELTSHQAKDLLRYYYHSNSQYTSDPNLEVEWQLAHMYPDGMLLGYDAEGSPITITQLELLEAAFGSDALHEGWANYHDQPGTNGYGR